MAKRSISSGPKLKYMPDQDFEDEAALLLAEYGRKHAQILAPPVPIDEIVELFLELQLEFLDMPQLFGVDDVHGALWVNERRIGIDQRLDPAANPRQTRSLPFHAGPRSWPLATASPVVSKTSQSTIVAS